MRTVPGEILAFPNESVTLAWFHAIAPQVRPPQKERRLNFTFLSIVIESRLTRYLVLDQPPDGECGLVSIRFGIERAACISGIDTAGQIGNLQVRELVLEFPEYHGDVLLQHAGVFGKFAQIRRPHLSLLYPHKLHLPSGDAGILDALVHYGPR
jgi:hypothetical protein